MIVTSTGQELCMHADVVQRMHAASTAVYPEEGCGLLLGHWGLAGRISVKQAVVVPNMADAGERSTRYAIAPRLMLEWERIGQTSGLSIVGFFHSHPDAWPVPSETDRGLAWPGYAYVIVSTRGGASAGAPAWVSGMAAWTFVEASASFVEVAVTVEVAADEIDYFI